jgi:UDP-N-acetylmuramoyl-tripeptide--D-alanyl-D-alanine ligase
VRLALPGAHQAVNAAAVFAACAAAGVDPDLVAEVLSGLEPEAGRGASFDLRLADGGAVRVVDDSYNANPVSMGAAIARLGAERVRGAGRRIAVLGEMLELGPKSADMHAELAGPLEAASAQLVIGVGEGMRALVDALPAGATARYADAPQTALDMLTSELRDGDVVLIKGSNASGVHNIVASLREGAAVASSEV